MRRIVISGLIALAAVLGSVLPANAAPAGTNAAPAGTTATAAPTSVASGLSPATTAVGIVLGSRISCGSASRCLAVGANFANQGGNPVTTAKARNGATWTSVTVPVPAGTRNADLADVSCTSASFCLAVGAYNTASEPTYYYQPLAVVWNGTAMQRTAAPPSPAHAIYTSLLGVSCLRSNSTFCVAVGTALVNSPVGEVTFADIWNGKTWTLRTVPTPSGELPPEIFSVSCVSTTQCFVAGLSVLDNGNSKALIASWNLAGTLSEMTVPLPGGVTDAFIAQLSCFSASRCAAVGNPLVTSPAGRFFGFTLVSTGTSWTAATVAWPKGTTQSYLSGVTCASAASCVAVGSDGTAKTGAAAAVAFNGRTWSLQRVPAPAQGKSSDFAGVSCWTSANCTTIGTITASGGLTATPLAGLWNGSSWTLAAI